MRGENNVLQSSLSMGNYSLSPKLSKDAKLVRLQRRGRR